jgi:XRE family transcriptional regulator, regulator of sulfur utilization
LGSTIRAYRKAAGLTQEQLSEKADLSPKYFGEVERGVVNISLDAMVGIAKALKISAHDLTRGLQGIRPGKGGRELGRRIKICK